MKKYRLPCLLFAFLCSAASAAAVPPRADGHVPESYDIDDGRDLGVIDMRQIAPTLARILGVRLPHPAEPALQLSRLPSQPTSSVER